MYIEHLKKIKGFFKNKKQNQALFDFELSSTSTRGIAHWTQWAQWEHGGPVSQHFWQLWDSCSTGNPTTEQLWQELRGHQNLKQATLLWVWGATRHLNIPGMVSLETFITTTL